MPQATHHNRIAAAIDAFAKGEMVVVMDDDDRENEGDIFLAASHATAEKLAFIIRHSSGIVCAPLPLAYAQRLNLAPMVAVNDAPLSTAFTVSVDVKAGLTTGISASERAATLRALADETAKADDFVRPGHVFPLIARDGGVLMRSGHTEAVVDLCRLANVPPVGVICELVNDDGTLKRGNQVVEFAQEHGLKVLTIAEMIAHRQARESLVQRVTSKPVETRWGAAQLTSYKAAFEAPEHAVLAFGDIHALASVPVRFHRADFVADLLGDAQALNSTVAKFKQMGGGVLVYLRGANLGGFADVNAPQDDEHHGAAIARQKAWREVGLGAQILRDMGISRIHLLSRRTRRYVGLEGFGIEITAQEVV